MCNSLFNARHLVASALSIAVNAVPGNAGMDTLEGWDSLGHMRIVLALEQNIGRALDTEEILAISDVINLAEILEKS